MLTAWRCPQTVNRFEAVAREPRHAAPLLRTGRRKARRPGPATNVIGSAITGGDEMATIGALRIAIILPAIAALTALPAMPAWARTGTHIRIPLTGMHHRHAPPGLGHQGRRAIPIFPFSGGCTDRGSPYWPCQTIPY